MRCAKCDGSGSMEIEGRVQIPGSLDCERKPVKVTCDACGGSGQRPEIPGQEPLFG